MRAPGADHNMLCCAALCGRRTHCTHQTLWTKLTCLPVWCRASNQSRWTEEKRLRVWLPPGYDRERPPPGGWPLLIMNDGQNLFEDQWAHQARASPHVCLLAPPAAQALHWAHAAAPELSCRAAWLHVWLHATCLSHAALPEGHGHGTGAVRAAS